jgi:hypothetical protein
MSDPKPMNVYPDPNGGAARNNMVPSDTRLAAGSIASGAAAVVTAVAGSGTAPGGSFLFLQYLGHTVAPGGFLGFHAANGTYVGLFIFFAALSVVLATINLILGIRLRARLLPLSERVGKACAGPGGVLEWWKTAAPK